MVAISFTTILIQVQAAYQGNARTLLPVLIAALLVMAGVARLLWAKAGLTRIIPRMPAFSASRRRRAFLCPMMVAAS